MVKNTFAILLGAFLLAAHAGMLVFAARTARAKTATIQALDLTAVTERQVVPSRPFEVSVIVHGRPLEEYAARGRSYVEAIEGAEYQLRLHNPLPYRVAVALAVDGLNTIDARHTSAWEASKWVIEPYGTISISGWQVSSSRARNFYFTTERDSYGAKMGQTQNLGVISAVFFREQRPVPIVRPEPRPIHPPYEEQGRADRDSKVGNAQSASAGKSRRAEAYPVPDDESAATGIGRSVSNDVYWVNMDLDSRPVSEIVIRYEYYNGLVRLGIVPRPYARPDSLRRREDARGFEDRRFSPEP